MPKMGESITEGTIINWLLEEGESFNEGDILLEVATDKVDNEVPAPFSGKIIEIKADAQQVVPVGEILALLEKDENGGRTSRNTEVPIQKPLSNKIDSPKSQKRESTSSEKPFRVTNSNRFYSPLVIEIAKEHHISFEELARIPSSGDNGRLRKSDVYRYIQDGRPYKFAQPVEDSGFKLPDLKFDKGKGRIIEMDRMRKMISDHMVYSKHVSPHVTSYVEADLTDLVAWRKNHKEDFQEKYGEKLTFTPLFIEAVAKAIEEFPNINASVDGNKIIVKEEINIGMATALPNGNLIVPVVRDADKKNLVSLAKNVNQLVEKARNN
ncbi:MAG: dihydrolipoamide acetyltransferase family protein, partial [Flavobacteriaceae bacterium]|nr:dihydrolipoamide acetyltransferase family protein [Flavobacteriaceae bacterium]